VNRSRLAALSAGAMFLVASLLVPATALAAGTGTIKVLGAPTINPPATGGSFTVTVAANGAVPISGAGAGLSFDNTKLTLTAIAKDATETANGASYLGFPTAAATAAFIATANTAGQIPNISWSYLDGVSSETAGTDHGIFTATFTVTATGDNVLTPNASPTLLDGQAASYGSAVTVTVVNGNVVNSSSPVWSLSAPASAVVLTGATSANYTVSTSVSQGTPGAISLSATGLPSGVTANFAPASGSDAFSTTLTFTATGAAVPGTTTVTVTGTDASSVSHSQTISLTVAGNNDFGISRSPASASVTGGAGPSSPVTVSTTILTGAPGTIALAATGLPTGVTASFAAASVAAGAGTTVTFTADATAVSGAATVTITGTSSGSPSYSHSVTVSLNVIVTPAGGQNVNVTGTLDAGFLALTCPTSLSISLLRGNTNQLNVPCSVYTNTVWNLNVNDTATDAYKGYMVTGRPVNDATGPYHMADSMHVLADAYIDVAGNTQYHNNVDLSAGGTVLTGSNSASAPLVLSQFVRASTQPGTYGIQVLFSAVSVF